MPASGVAKRFQLGIVPAVTRHASSVLVLALLCVTAIEFAVTERLKLEMVPVEPTHVAKAFSPVCKCDKARALIRFIVRRADTLTVSIVNGHGQTVRDLAVHRRVLRGQPAFRWDGRDANGRIVPDGIYRIRLLLGREARTIHLPQVIVVDTVRPVAQLTSFRPHVIAAGARPRVVVTYRLSEPSHAVLFVDGVRRVLTFSSARSGRFQWFARIGRKRLPSGRYRLQLAALDAAGNLGPRTPTFVVRVR